MRLSFKSYLILERIAIQPNVTDTITTTFTTAPVRIKVQTHLKSLFIDLLILPIIHPGWIHKVAIKRRYFLVVTINLFFS